ncbi:MAG TPA: nickel ABC transporter substrate-binding protein [Candidatus Enterocloster excrementigallinarum]|uniref:Nickel ABC transporter substrate-binding protein n=1 Tax=Candidatus Enterocloster excrementigallinarum TaxID=2838558 RepID=A0A9D2PV79_9FIRM|nr:nickel ABC transporter substrate-binding protein [Candidatus Enterocloster excrementigallinarum]
MKKKWIAVLLVSALAAAAAAGCGQSGESQGADSQGAQGTSAQGQQSAEGGERDELVFVNYRDIRDLNPHLYAGEMYAQSILYDTLVSTTAEGYEGCLAEDWTISEDGRVYTFNIRDNVLFSDGTPCDANAILANFNAIIENKDRHTWLEMMNLLVGVSAPDEDTLVIELSEPYYPMLTELSCIRPFAMISPECMIDGSTKDGVNGYIGTGPYVLTDFVTDEYAVFERNENYWGEAPAIRKITVKVIPDNQTRIMALESGEIDLIFGKNMIDADAISQYLDSEQFTVGLSDPTSTRHIVLNTTHEILGDLAVRQALQHATNRQAISDGIFYGLEQPADTLYASTIPYCDVELEPYAYDAKEAARILDEAGWVMGSDGIREKDGVKLQLDLLYNSDSVTEKTISEYLQSEYLKLGISMNIHGEEEQSYRDNMKAGNFDMVFNICWGMPYDPQSSLAAMRAPVYGDYAAQQGLEDKAQIDEAITNILTSTDGVQRQELYDFVLTRLHEDAVYIPLTYECNKALYTSELQGVHFGTDQYDVPFGDMYF